MTRLYTNPSYEGEVAKARLTETYNHSAHWIVEIQPRGFGVNPPWLRVVYSDLEDPPDGNTFRIELAADIAKKLTTTSEYELSK